MAEIKGIFLVLEAGKRSESRLQLAVALAETHAAALTVLCTPIDTISVADCYTVGRDAVAEMLSHWESSAAHAFARTQEDFRAATAGRDVEGHWLQSSPSERARDLALRARCFDLSIVGNHGAHDLGSRELAERVALASGTPCLVVPEPSPRSSGLDRVLVAWNGSREAKRALADGLAILKGAKDVEVIIVDDTAAEQDVLHYLKRHDVEAHCRHIEAAHGDVAQTLLDQCANFSADVLIMGAYGHSRAMETALGGTTHKILAQTSHRVMMSH